MKLKIIHSLFIAKSFHPHLSQQGKVDEHSLSPSAWSQLLSFCYPWVLFEEALAALNKSLAEYQEVCSSGGTEGAAASSWVNRDGGGGGGRVTDTFAVFV